MKEFVTALQQSEEEQDSITFKIDKREIKAYRPTAAQYAIAMSALGRRNNTGQKLAAIIDFFVEVLDEESQIYVENRLLDRTDPFGLDDVDAILEWMIEEWSARPTEQPSDSGQSPGSGGQKSTRRTTKSTSSRSRSTVS